MFHGDNDKVVNLTQSQHMLKGYQALNLQAQLYVEEGKKHGWITTEKEKKIILTFLEGIFK